MCSSDLSQFEKHGVLREFTVSRSGGGLLGQCLGLFKENKASGTRIDWQDCGCPRGLLGIGCRDENGIYAHNKWEKIDPTQAPTAQLQPANSAEIICPGDEYVNQFQISVNLSK